MIVVFTVKAERDLEAIGDWIAKDNRFAQLVLFKK
jgi:hypothetical protein